jgi:glycerol-3-phosphate dehydrogenase
MEAMLGAARNMADLGEHFGAGLTTAELDYLIANEWAVTAEDILWRRTKLGLHMTDAERANVERHLAERESTAHSHALART